MPLGSAIFTFEQGKQGWTETWSREFGTVPDFLNRAQTLSGFLIDFRSSLTVLRSVRVITVGVPRPRIGDYATFNITGSRPGGTAPTGPDPVQSACLVRCNTTGGGARSVLLRGMSDDDVVRDPNTGRSLFRADWLQDLAAMANQLFLDNWGFLTYDPALPWTAITAMNPDPVTPGRWILTPIAGSPEVTAGVYVHFRGVPKLQLPWLKGNFLVKASTPDPNNTFSIDTKPIYQPSISGKIDTTRMFYRGAGWVSNIVDNLQALEWRKRATGRPTLITRGREPGLHWRR